MTGAGSRWTNGSYLLIGLSGDGALAVSDSGEALSDYLYVGTIGRGALTISAGGSVSATSAAEIGLFSGSNGTLWIGDGGTLSSTSSGIGSGAGATGAVTVTGPGSQWISNDALMVGDQGKGALTVSDGGSVSAPTLQLANAAGSVGTINIGAASGAPAAAAGTLAASRLVFGAGAGTLVLNHTSSDYLFAPALSGTGSIEVEHGRTVLSGDSSAFAGTASIGTGTLAVNGLLGGAIDVGTAGRLQGTGTVGHTTVSGTVAPGNSIGTLHVDGDIGFHPGSVYEVEVNAAGQSDRIAATGNATLDGGTVRVLAGSGGYAPLTRYTILTADGGRTGAFDGVASNLAFLDPSLDYDANSVYLTMQRNDTSFAGIGQTRNQIAAGGGAESLGLGNPVHAAVVGLSAAQARAAFDQLSGEVHASARAALVEDSRFVRDAANDRIRAAFDGVAASGAPAAAACGNGAARGAGAGGTAGCAVWGRGFGSWGHAGGDGNAARLDRSTGGFLIGVDAPAFDGWRLGAVMGYSHTRFDVKDRGASGSSDNYHLGLYGGSRWGTLHARRPGRRGPDGQGHGRLAPRIRQCHAARGAGLRERRQHLLDRRRADRPRCRGDRSQRRLRTDARRHAGHLLRRPVRRPPLRPVRPGQPERQVLNGQADAAHRPPPGTREAGVTAGWLAGAP